VSAGAPGTIVAEHEAFGSRELWCEGTPTLLFTENESNTERLWGSPNATPHVKDAFHEYVVHGKTDAVNPDLAGTKAAAHYVLNIPPHGSTVVHLHHCGAPLPARPHRHRRALRHAHRRSGRVLPLAHPAEHHAEEANVMRQALAGMLWSKQHYFFDLDTWLEEHNVTLRDSGGSRATAAGST
jgi:hypothetical protein